ncbi:MAG: hypothetical protein ABI612_22125 [Betaproteobacteria bacterium]
MLNSYTLLSALQNFLHQREVEVDTLTADPAVVLMIDWFRLERFGMAAAASSPDVLVYRYGGWSEGCATGFNFSLFRRITDRNPTAEPTDWVAGITLMFEPSRLAGLERFSTVSSDWQSLDAFLHAIESSAAYKAVVATQPMSVLIESGGLR